MENIIIIMFLSVLKSNTRGKMCGKVSLTSGRSGIWMILLKNSISLALLKNCVRLRGRKALIRTNNPTSKERLRTFNLHNSPHKQITEALSMSQ